MEPDHQNDDAVSDGYFPSPYSLDPMPDTLRHSLVAPGIAGILSALSTFALILFIFHRLISWRKHYHTFIGYNQYVMLVLNLLFADFQQSTAFLISWYWIKENKIVAPTAACFAQGWLLHSGDVSSALFVLAIAIHTFLTAVMARRISNTVFYSCIAMLWVLAYVLTVIGVALHPDDYFVRAGSWCWVSSKYENERLFLHYIWIFLVEAAIVAVYAVTFVALRRKTNQLFKNYREDPYCANPKTIEAVNRVTSLMTLYPCVYILLTLPLSAGRMWSMAHGGAQTSDAFSCGAGALLASCGWADALLYTLTRKRLLNETMPGRAGRGESQDLRGNVTIEVHAYGGEEQMQDFMNEHQQHLQHGAEPKLQSHIIESAADDPFGDPRSESKALRRLGLDSRTQGFELGRPQRPYCTIAMPRTKEAWE